MSLSLSWWVLALAIGVTAPLWVRALVQRWEAQAAARTDRLLARLPKDPPEG